MFWPFDDRRLSADVGFEIALMKKVWIAYARAGGLVQPVQLILSECKLQSLYIVLKLRQLGRTDDR